MSATRFNLPQAGCGLAIEDTPKLVRFITELYVPDHMDRTVLLVMAIDNCFDVPMYPDADGVGGSLSCAMGTAEVMAGGWTVTTGETS